VRVVREFRGKLGRRFLEAAPAVQSLVPPVEVDIVDEAQPSLVIGDLPDEEAVGIPAVEDVADVENDGSRSRDGLSPGAP
jgi:hypothetical protein